MRHRSASRTFAFFRLDIDKQRKCCFCDVFNDISKHSSQLLSHLGYLFLLCGFLRIIAGKIVTVSPVGICLAAFKIIPSDRRKIVYTNSSCPLKIDKMATKMVVISTDFTYITPLVEEKVLSSLILLYQTTSVVQYYKLKN